MLVIRRHAGESILIGGEIEIEVIECGHNRVKLGIRAPRQVTVLRSEVKQTLEQNLEAARSLAIGAIPEVPGDAVRSAAPGATHGLAVPFLAVAAPPPSQTTV